MRSQYYSNFSLLVGIPYSIFIVVRFDKHTTRDKTNKKTTHTHTESERAWKNVNRTENTIRKKFIWPWQRSSWFRVIWFERVCAQADDENQKSKWVSVKKFNMNKRVKVYGFTRLYGVIRNQNKYTQKSIKEKRNKNKTKNLYNKNATNDF